MIFLSQLVVPTKDPIVTSKRVHKHRNHRCHHHHHHHHRRHHQLKKKNEPTGIVPRVNRTSESKALAGILKNGQKAPTSATTPDQTTVSEQSFIRLNHRMFSRNRSKEIFLYNLWKINWYLIE